MAGLNDLIRGFVNDEIIVVLPTNKVSSFTVVDIHIPIVVNPPFYIPSTQIVMCVKNALHERKFYWGYTSVFMKNYNTVRRFCRLH